MRLRMWDSKAKFGEDKMFVSDDKLCEIVDITNKFSNNQQLNRDLMINIISDQLFDIIVEQSFFMEDIDMRLTDEEFDELETWFDMRSSYSQLMDMTDATFDEVDEDFIRKFGLDNLEISAEEAYLMSEDQI